MIRGNITTWLGREANPVLAHVHLPKEDAEGVVVLCPPLGREQVASYRAMRQLGDALARRGLVAVRLNWSGQSDSAPIDESLPLLENWAADMESVGRQLREAGATRITWLGLRAGALVLGRQAQALHDAGLLDALLLWDLPASGRNFLRHEQLLYTSDGLATDDDGDFHALGYSLRAADADEMRGLKPRDFARPEVPTGTIVRGEVPGPFPGADGIWSSTEQEAMLETSSMTAVVPRSTIASIVHWCVQQRGQAAPFNMPVRESAEFDVVDGQGATTRVRETAVTLPTGLPGIVTEPLQGSAHGTSGVLYVAASSEPLDGPSGLWALSARRVAALGQTALRIDKHGTGELGGELPTDPSPYMPGFTGDVALAAHWLAQRTGELPIGVGLCSGVYFEMVRPNGPMFSKVVGINLLAFDRDPADIPDEVAMATDPSHLAAMEGAPAKPNLKQRVRGTVKTQMPQPMWRWLGRAGIAHSPDDFLREAAQDTELVLAFSPEDFAALRQQRGEAAIAWARRAGGPFQVVVDPELDHALFGVRARRRCLDLIDTEVLRSQRLARVAAS